MARQLRIQYPGAFYHVTSRGNGRQAIYRNKEDYAIFLKKLSDSLEVYNVSLISYVCMTNHFHLLLTTPDGNLSDFMRHFNIGYTSAFNRRHNRSGHLYQGRYKSYLIEADSYLEEVSRYIHLNPVRIKKHSRKDIKEKRRLLREYKYSSFAGYANLNKRESFLNYSMILDCFGGDTAQGRRRYRKFVGQGLKDRLLSPLESGKGTGIVGSEDFMEEIRGEYLDKSKAGAQREQPDLKKFKKKVQPGKLIDEFCRIAKVDKNYVCSRGRNTTDRAILMEMLYRHCQLTQPEIGLLAGGIDYSAVSYSRKRLRQKMENDLKLKRRFDSLEKDLSRLKIW